MIRHPLPILFAALLMCGCTQQASSDRSGRLLAMAAEEAANIPSTLERFSRQLNIADTQIRTGRKADADKSLLLARDTLTASKDATFDHFHRIAGWTAISQLARGADDRDLALKSSDLALQALNDVTPVADRAQYVISLSSELANLRGKTDAVELLTSGGAWAGQIPDQDTRRRALVAFTYRLVSYEAFEAARTTLRHDTDPTWRADTFLAMANNVSPYKTVAIARVGGAGGASAAGSPMALSRQVMEDSAASPSMDFGVDVRYEKVYKH